MQKDEKQIEIKASDDVLRGHYANAMQVSHSNGEFFLDFLLIHPPVGQIVDRVIVSPAHMKRMVKALEENLKRFEDNFGKIEETEEPKGIGFRAE